MRPACRLGPPSETSSLPVSCAAWLAALPARDGEHPPRLAPWPRRMQERKVLGRLRIIREDLRRGRFPELTVGSLARAVVALDPFVVFEGSCWTGSMARLVKSGNLFSFGNDPILLTVRSADKRSGERKIAWLLGQLGLPPGSRSGSSFVAAQERAA